MKLVLVSDLHTEFGVPWTPPSEDVGDVLVLAGDITVLNNYDPLEQIFQAWTKPIIYVLGNHEYYTQHPMDEENRRLQLALEGSYPHVRLLLDEPCTIDGVNFFGGTMWTDFNGANPNAMWNAQNGMNDFRLIRAVDGSVLRPQDTVGMHNRFTDKLCIWFESMLDGPRVVVTHHAPCMNPNTQYRDSPLQPAFSSLDMVKEIEEYQPDVWISGHTHENMDHHIGVTRVLSNQRGYSGYDGTCECRDFVNEGKVIEI